MANPDTTELNSLREDFAALHGFLSQAGTLAVPLEPDAFTSRYGEVEAVNGMADVQDSLRALREAEAGWSPRALKQMLAGDVRVLTHSSPPAGIYPRTVWFAERAGQAAGTMVSTLESLKGLTESAVSEGQRASAVRNIFKGERGLIATAKGVAEDAEQLAASVDALLPVLVKAIQVFHTTPLLREADDVIRTLGSRSNGLRQRLDEAERKAKRLIGRGRAAAEAEQLAGELEQVSEALERKKLLSADLQQFLPGSERALAAIRDISGKVRGVGRIFDQAASRFSSVISLPNDAQISSYQWLTGAVELPANIAKWQSVQEASRQFVQNSLVDFDA